MPRSRLVWCMCRSSFSLLPSRLGSAGFSLPAEISEAVSCSSLISRSLPSCIIHFQGLGTYIDRSRRGGRATRREPYRCATAGSPIHRSLAQFKEVVPIFHTENTQTVRHLYVLISLMQATRREQVEKWKDRYNA